LRATPEFKFPAIGLVILYHGFVLQAEAQMPWIATQDIGA
jgi:hypothetical protein